MIKSIKHKGLIKFYTKGDGNKLPSAYLKKINRLFDMLDAVAEEEDIKSLGNGVHRLKGTYQGFWALSISPNFRLIFRFEGGDIFDVDYLDYH